MRYLQGTGVACRHSVGPGWGKGGAGGGESNRAVEGPASSKSDGEDAKDSKVKVAGPAVEMGSRLPDSRQRAEAPAGEGKGDGDAGFTDLESGRGVQRVDKGASYPTDSPIAASRMLARSNSETDVDGGVRSRLAEDALQPDGHFAVPNLKQVLSERIVQPRLPAEAGDPVHKESDLDLRHLEKEVRQFKAFLRSIVMHAAVGTTVGGISTMVGEPQNLIVAKRMRWDFGGFIYQMLPVSITVLPCAVTVLVLCEKTCRFGYGAKMPEEVRWVLADFADKEFGRMKRLDKAKLIAQVG